MREELRPRHQVVEHRCAVSVKQQAACPYEDIFYGHRTLAHPLGVEREPVVDYAVDYAAGHSAYAGGQSGGQPDP